MSATGKPGGLLSGLPNPAAKKPAVAPVVSAEAEQAFGLAPTAIPNPAEAAAPAPEPRHDALHNVPPPAEPERSKTFFLPYSICERLEMQKLSERREMKHIVRHALEDYFERHPLRAAVEEAFRR